MMLILKHSKEDPRKDVAKEKEDEKVIVMLKGALWKEPSTHPVCRVLLKMFVSFKMPLILWKTWLKL